jgi:hypothetical protein
MFASHQIIPNLLQNKYCCWAVVTLSVCSFGPCFIPRSRKPTIRFSVLSLINKPWSIIFEGLLFTHFLLQQGWPKSRSRTLLVLISVFIYHPVGSVALRLVAFFGSTIFCEEAFSQLNPKAVWLMNTLYNLHLCLSNYESSFSELSQEIQGHA